MQKKPSLTALGELLIDFTPLKNDASGVKSTGKTENPCFEQNPGGAPANVLACFAKLGGISAFIGAVGKDSFGDFLETTIKSYGICADGLVRLEDQNTTLAFVHLDKHGDRSFSFYRRPGADTCLSIPSVSVKLIEQADIFHFGSLSLTNEPSRGATYFAAEKALELGKIISFDPNWRPPLWKSQQEAIVQMKKGASYANVLKVSEEEATMLTGINNPQESAKKLCDSGIPLVVVTLGPEGCCFCHKNASTHVSTFDIPAVDTTGAGDAFWGAFLYRLSGILINGRRIPSLSKEELREMCMFANASGSLCASRRGALPALASIEEIAALCKTDTQQAHKKQEQRFPE